MKRRFWLIAIVLMLVLSMSLMLLASCGGSKKDKDEEEDTPKYTQDEEVDIIIKALNDAYDNIMEDAKNGVLQMDQPASIDEYIDYLKTLVNYACDSLDKALKRPSHVVSIVVDGENPSMQLVMKNGDKVTHEFKEGENGAFVCMMIGSIDATKSGWEATLDREAMTKLYNEQIEKAKIATSVNEADSIVHNFEVILIEIAQRGTTLSSEDIVAELSNMFPSLQYIRRIYIDIQADNTALITCVTSVLTSKQDSNHYILVDPNLTETSEIVAIPSGEGVIAMQREMSMRGVNAGNIERIVVTYENGTWTGMQIDAPTFTEEEEVAIIVDCFNATAGKLVEDINSGEINPQNEDEVLNYLGNYFEGALNKDFRRHTQIRSISVTNGEVFVINKVGRISKVAFKEGDVGDDVFNGIQGEFTFAYGRWSANLSIIDMSPAAQKEREEIKQASIESYNAISNAENILEDFGMHNRVLDANAVAAEFNKTMAGCKYLHKVYIDFYKDEYSQVAVAAITNKRTDVRYGHDYWLVDPNTTDTTKVFGVVKDGEGLVGVRGISRIYVDATNIVRIVLTYENGTWTGSQYATL